MRSIVIKLTLLLSLSPVAFAQSPFVPSLKPTPPTLSSKAYLLIDANSNQVISQHNSDMQVEPASLTKMMTMFIIDNEIKSGKLKLTDQVLVSKNAWQTPGSRMFLNVNSRVSVEDLIRGIIIQSGNDATVAMAEHIAGSEQTFADLMNSYAQMLGMTHSHFVNATGLPDKDHYTTAQDMAILGRALIQNFPETYKIYAQKEYVYNGIRQYNRNQLLWRNEMVDGIKTGHTDNAGYCLVASAKAPTHNMRLIAVIMGARNEKVRSEEANKLLTWGMRFYETTHVYTASNKLQDVRVWMGKDNELPVGFTEDLYVTAPQGNYKRFKASINLVNSIKAPVKKGDVLGSYVIHDENSNVVAERPIVALKDIKKGNFFQRGIDFVKMGVDSVVNKFKS